MKPSRTNSSDKIAVLSKIQQISDKNNHSHLVFGVIGGACATFSAIRRLSYTHFVPPCYLASLYSDTKEDISGGSINCCGPFQNITIYSEPKSCSNPKLDFYE